MKPDLSSYDDILRRIESGRQGRTAYLPVGWETQDGRNFGFHGLSKHIAVEKGRYTVVAGDTGTGKSAFVDQVYALSPIEYMFQHPESNVKFEALIWKMERKDEALAKWMSQHIWQKHRILTDYRTLMSYADRGRLPDHVFEIVAATRDYFEMLFSHIKLFGSKNPTGIYHALNEYAAKRGKITVDEKKRFVSYTPNDPLLITVVIVDHIGIMDEESRDGKLLTDKALIDKTSEYLRKARDRYGFSPVVSQQLNRGMSDSTRRTKMVLKPEKGDFEGSSRPMQDSDLTMAFLDPSKFDKDEYFGYDIPPTINKDGYCRFRGLHVIKNSYGADNLHFGLGFLGEVGLFNELPPAARMSTQDYTRLRSFEDQAVWSYETDKTHTVVTVPGIPKAEPAEKLLFSASPVSFDSLYDDPDADPVDDWDFEG